MGLILGIIFFLINLFFLLAVISEYGEIAEDLVPAMQLIVAGFAIFILNLIFSTTMIYKYSANHLQS